MLDFTTSHPLGSALTLCRRHFVAAAGFSALVNLLYICPTLYMLQVYDRVLPTRGLQTLLFLTMAVLLALATLSLLDRVRARLLVGAGVQLDAALAPVILDTALGRPNLAVSRQALREFDILRATLSGQAILAIFDTPWVPIYIMVCFLVHPWIGILAIAGCMILPAIAWATELATRARLDRAQNVAGTSYANQEVLLGSADTVRALGMRRAMVARQMRQRDAMMTAQTEASFAAGSYLSATKFTRLALQSLALGLGAWLAVNKQISGGAIFAASFLITRALAPIEQLVGNWKPIAQARHGYANLKTLLDAATVRKVSTQLQAPTGALAVERLTIRNERGDGVILDGVSFSAIAGEVIAIVGPSGAGKSTLMRAIAGALTPDRGVIRVDGSDMRDWDPERLAGQVGYLPQDSVLFAGTVAENISRFAGELDTDRSTIDAAVVAAACKVGAQSLIQRLPGGYDHALKLGGRGVSAGQSQRIALARAVYRDPRLLILDEPNAHLDAEGDVALVEALSALKENGTTILVVSHKLGILPVVDKMLVLRDGKIALFGPRDQVLPKIAPANLRTVASTIGTSR